MGYSLNWRRPTEVPAAAFAAAVLECRVVLPDIGVEFAGLDGSGNPIFDDDHITLNGRQPRACEPFEISRVEFDRRGRPQVSSCCKTERQPYDLCVKVALIILAHHIPDVFSVGSDGDEDELAEAKRLVQMRLGFGADFCLRRD